MAQGGAALPPVHPPQVSLHRWPSASGGVGLPIQRSLANTADWRVWLAGCSVCVIALSLRSVNLCQPLLENFIDRQIQTAMMARNLARDGSMLYPKVDIGPF